MNKVSALLTSCTHSCGSNVPGSGAAANHRALRSRRRMSPKSTTISP